MKYIPIIIMLLACNNLSASSLESQFLIDVTVDQKTSGGEVWDGMRTQARQPPDTLIKIDGIIVSDCKNEYKCKGIFTENKDKFHVEIYDSDPGPDQLVGEGICEVNTKCRLDGAEIAISKKPLDDWRKCTGDKRFRNIIKKSINEYYSKEKFDFEFVSIVDCDVNSESGIMNISYDHRFSRKAKYFISRNQLKLDSIDNAIEIIILDSNKNFKNSGYKKKFIDVKRNKKLLAQVSIAFSQLKEVIKDTKSIQIN